MALCLFSGAGDCPHQCRSASCPARTRIIRAEKTFEAGGWRTKKRKGSSSCCRTAVGSRRTWERLPCQTPCRQPSPWAGMRGGVTRGAGWTSEGLFRFPLMIMQPLTFWCSRCFVKHPSLSAFCHVCSLWPWILPPLLGGSEDNLAFLMFFS